METNGDVRASFLLQQISVVMQQCNSILMLSDCCTAMKVHQNEKKMSKISTVASANRLHNFIKLYYCLTLGRYVPKIYKIVYRSSVCAVRGWQGVA